MNKNKLLIKTLVLLTLEIATPHPSRQLIQASINLPHREKNDYANEKGGSYAERWGGGMRGGGDSNDSKRSVGLPCLFLLHSTHYLTAYIYLIQHTVY